MLGRRGFLLLAGGATAAALAGCTPAPSPTPDAPVLDLTVPGAAPPLLQALCDAAGSDTLVKIELTRTEASVAVLTGPKHDQAETWAWREGRAQRVDGDTQNVGQAQFRLSDFDLSDVGRLFSLAAVVSGSARDQVLQVVQYSGRQVLMNVTTQPESFAVFFRPDGTVVRPLDLGWPADLTDALADAVDDLFRVSTVALTPSIGLWAEMPRIDEVIRQIRAPRLPARREVREEVSPMREWVFPPSLVDPALLVDVAQRHGDGKPLPFTVDRRDHLSFPVLRWQIDGKLLALDPDGQDISSRVR